MARAYSAVRVKETVNFMVVDSSQIVTMSVADDSAGKGGVWNY